MKRKLKPRAKDRLPVHDNIKALRCKLELTQEELARRVSERCSVSLDKKVSVDKTVISHWENAAGAPRIEMLPDVAAELGVTVDELLARGG